MDIKTFGELIDWTRDLHQHLANCLGHCATVHEEERARALLEYLATHEAEMARMVDEFERQSARNTLETRVYDYLKHNPIETHRTCDEPYAKLDFQGIYREVMDYHRQVMDLYKSLSEKAEIPEARELLSALLKMETNESMRLSRQIGRMDDV
ncbi:ATPase [Marinobacter sp. C2H3]|uniref:ATPase n=1 Tax=Marinobacter sp. C2H3 TaxID=3119003 RepID=UPI00300E70CD